LPLIAERIVKIFLLRNPSAWVTHFSCRCCWVTRTH
jgi:hypothetical protein